MKLGSRAWGLRLRCRILRCTCGDLCGN